MAISMDWAPAPAFAGWLTEPIAMPINQWQPVWESAA